MQALAAYDLLVFACDEWHYAWSRPVLLAPFFTVFLFLGINHGRLVGLLLIFILVLTSKSISSLVSQSCIFEGKSTVEIKDRFVEGYWMIRGSEESDGFLALVR